TLNGFLAAAEKHRAPGLVAVEVDEVLLLRARAEQALGPVEMRARLLRAVLRHQNVAAEQMRPREMEAVVRRLQESHGTADVVQRCSWAATNVVQPRERPEEPDPRVPVGDRVRLLEDAVEHVLGSLEIAEIGQRVAQVRGEPDLRRQVLRLDLLELREAVLEDLDSAPGLPARRVGVAEGCKDVGPGGGGDRRELKAGLEPLDRL